MNWIFSSYLKDSLLLYLPGHICLILLLTANFYGLGSISLFLTATIFIFIDSGHVYTTFLRSLKEGISSVNKQKIFKFLIIYSLIMLFIQFLDGSLIWKIALYATIFHYIKQNIGFLRFYERLEKLSKKTNRLYLYSFQLLGIFSIHFREDSQLEYYSSNDIFSFPNSQILTGIQSIYALLFIVWLYSSFKFYLKQKKINSTILYITSIAVLFSFPLFPFLKIQLVLIPFIASHGLPYMFLISKTLKIDQTRIYTKNLILLFVVLTALSFGAIETIVQENLINYIHMEFSMGNALFNVLFLAPLFLHFYMDSFLWKGNNIIVNQMFSQQNNK